MSISAEQQKGGGALHSNTEREKSKKESAQKRHSKEKKNRGRAPRRI